MIKKQLAKYGILFLSVLIGLASCKSKEEIGLKDAFKDTFLIGVAMNSDQIQQKNKDVNDLILKHYNSIVAENCMKSGIIQPVEGEFDFSLSDQLVCFGEKHKMFIVGHTLIWHSQVPKWFFVDEQGKDVSPEVLKQRMKTHIHTIVNRYKGRVNGWDVVNEAIEDDGSWRNSKFYQILGEDFVKLAFQYAREADPEAELYYNDYNMAKEGKRDAVVRMVTKLKEQGITVNGIGMQGHLMMDFPEVEDFEKSIIAFGSTGAKVMITELDLSALPNPFSTEGAEISLRADYEEKMNPYPNGLSKEQTEAQYKKFVDFFSVFIRQKDIVSRVTLWGVSDKDSWKNDWPIKGRTDYPLLFDRDYKPKPVVETIMKMTPNP